ncbi:MAG TPA: hypothetical protein PK867_13560 [Pirellulales bacterium]|nr:hypothetical protein [Pirellulales bacterium]
MFDAEKRSRFRTLQQRQDAGLASADEQAELAKLVGEIESGEVAYLTPATERTRQDRERVERQNHKLEELVRRREAFVERLRGFLADARREREVIESELADVLAEDSSDSSRK